MGRITPLAFLLLGFAARADSTPTSLEEALRPAPYESMTPFGGPLLGLQGGSTTTRAFGYQSEARGAGEASTYEGSVRLGWAFPVIPVDDYFRPLVSLFFEARLGVTDWSCCSGTSLTRATGARLQLNLLRTRWIDLYLNSGVAGRRDDVPGGGVGGRCAASGLPESACSGTEWRAAAGAELHLSSRIHLTIEPEWALNERARNALRFGILFR